MCPADPLGPNTTQTSTTERDGVVPYDVVVVVVR